MEINPLLQYALALLTAFGAISILVNFLGNQNFRVASLMIFFVPAIFYAMCIVAKMALHMEIGFVEIVFPTLIVFTVVIAFLAIKPKKIEF